MIVNPDVYEVVVGNVGQVWKGHEYTEALHHYVDYVDRSKTGRGRAGNEPVTLMENGEIINEYIPPGHEGE
jgi:hypothetical protein